MIIGLRREGSGRSARWTAGHRSGISHRCKPELFLGELSHFEQSPLLHFFQLVLHSSTGFYTDSGARKKRREGKPEKTSARHKRHAVHCPRSS